MYGDPHQISRGPTTPGLVIVAAAEVRILTPETGSPKTRTWGVS
jgi:hypothetical protein